MSSIRKRLTDEEAKYIGKSLNKKDKGRNMAKYRLAKNEWDKIKELRTLRQSEFKEVKRTLNDKGELISKVEKREQKKLIEIPDGHQIKRLSTNTTTGQQWIITEPNKDKGVEEFDIEGIIKKYIKPVKFKARKFPVELTDFDTLTISDVHIGMDTNKFKNSMYVDKWDSEEVLKVADIIYNKVVDEQSSQTLVIDELGDLLDGYNGKTTRGGHSLPQNMTNEEAFDLALQFKMYIADRLVNVYPNIIFNNVCNDNHAGSFGYFVNSAFKSIVNQKYKHLEVNNYRQFINHYYMGDIAFVITHGKDDVALKFGFKPHLDSKQIEKIDQYCKQKGIYKRAKRIIFKKGDSHQALFDMSGSDDFDYYNYPALSPSSQWIQTNFKKGRKGFVIEHYKGLENIIKPIFL